MAIHGIGDQYRNATIQSVVNIFGRCFDQAVAVPLGAFYSPDGKVEAFQLKPPPDVNPQMEDIGFVEVYWANIPRRVQRRGYTIEETKAWARTVTQRVRARYAQDLLAGNSPGRAKPLLQPRDYLSAAAAIDDMIDAIVVIGNLLFLAEKAGLGRFDLDELLTAFVGDVQIVADFANYRERILRQVHAILTAVRKKNPGADIYLVAHSEGTVVALLAVLQALSVPSPRCKSAEEEERHMWVRKVRGFMTIGSPIDKHIALWPDIWDPVQEPGTSWVPTEEDRIAWRNYYDYGDPVGFDLDTVREWLERHRWDPFFSFTADDDFGFARYFVPAKAHNDYWNDPCVFGHFICDVMGLNPVVDGHVMNKPAPPPPNRWPARISSYVTPFVFFAGLLAIGVYLPFAALNSYSSVPEPWYLTIRDVAGVTCLLAGATIASRLLCLTRRLGYKLMAFVAFVIGAAGYIVLRTDWIVSWSSPTAQLMQAPPAATDPFLANCKTVAMALALGVFAVLFSVVADRARQLLQQYPPLRLFARGARPLLIAGGLSAIILMVHRIVIVHHLFEASAASPGSLTPKSFWPVMLTGAGFLYLWWLAILVFDLSFVWQRYVRRAVWEKYLRRAREHLIERRRTTEAEGSPQQGSNYA